VNQGDDLEENGCTHRSRPFGMSVSSGGGESGNIIFC